MVKSYLVVTSPYREPLYNTFIVVRILTAKNRQKRGWQKPKVKTRCMVSRLNSNQFHLVINMTFKKIGVISEAGTSSSVNRNQIVRLGIRWWRNLQNRLLEISILSKQIPFFNGFFTLKKCESVTVRAFLRLKFRLPLLNSQNRARRKRLPIRGGSDFWFFKNAFLFAFQRNNRKKDPFYSSLKNHWTIWCRVCIGVTRSLSAVSSPMNKRKPLSMIGKLKVIRKKETSANFTLKIRKIVKSNLTVRACGVSTAE